MTTEDPVVVFLAAFASVARPARTQLGVHARERTLALATLLGAPINLITLPDDAPVAALGRAAGLAWVAGVAAASRAMDESDRAAAEAEKILSATTPLASLAQRLRSYLAGYRRALVGNLLANAIDDLVSGPDWLAALPGGTLAPIPEGILANPGVPGCSSAHDDDARRAFADSIRAAEPVRARYINASLARNDEAIGFVRAYSRRWSTPITAIVPGAEVGFGRGLMGSVRMAAATFLEHGNALYAVAPIVGVELTEVGSCFAELFASPLLSRIRGLTLREQKLPDAVAIALAHSTQLGNLVWLDVSGNRLQGAGLLALARSPLLPRWATVCAEGNPTDPTPVVIYSDGGSPMGEEPADAANGLNAPFAWKSSLDRPAELASLW